MKKFQVVLRGTVRVKAVVPVDAVSEDEAAIRVFALLNGAALEYESPADLEVDEITEQTSEEYYAKILTADWERVKRVVAVLGKEIA